MGVVRVALLRSCVADGSRRVRTSASAGGLTGRHLFSGLVRLTRRAPEEDVMAGPFAKRSRQKAPGQGWP